MRVAAKGRLTSVLVFAGMLAFVVGVVLGIPFCNLAAVDTASAEGVAPWWHVNVGSRPTDLTPGIERTIVVSAANLGDTDAEGNTGSPIVLRDVLPADVKVEKAFYLASAPEQAGGCAVHPASAGREEVECIYEGVLSPFLTLEGYIYVEVEPQALTAGTSPDEASVSGGGAAKVSTSESLKMNALPAKFGMETFEMVPENEDGAPETQAGAHPFQFTTTVILNSGDETLGKEAFEAGEIGFGDVVQPALPKDLSFRLPPGFVGNPSPFEQCKEGQFEKEKCPLGAQVGVAVESVDNPLHATDSVPVFNMVPAVGEPARFGFKYGPVPVFIDTSVRTGGDYGVTASVKNITEVGQLLSSQVTLWGWPGDPRHNVSRGYECTGVYPLFGLCTSPADPVKAPFLSLPTSCPAKPASEPFSAEMEGDSWPGPNKAQEETGLVEYRLHDALEPSIGLDGCDRLGFEPSIDVSPDVPEASKSTGVNVDLHVPQEAVLTPNGLAESDVKETTVRLPQGLAVNPAGADGLEACTEAEVGYEPGVSPPAGSPPGGFVFSEGLPEPFCPNAAKIGKATITTPLLPNPLEGAVYIATQDENPFKSLLALYLVAEDPKAGVLVKLPGKVLLCQNAGEEIAGQACEAPGQMTAAFASPQLPFEDAKFEFFGGERAPLTTPPLCKGGEGEEGYKTTTVIESWAENGARTPSSEFDITEGPNGGPCPNRPPFSPSLAQLPFSPSLTAGTTSNQAGGFSPFTMTMSREDGDQQLQGVQLHMPAGLLGMLSKVTPCEEARANNGTCGPESEIGETTASVGVGGRPYTVAGGRVYITGPYHGTPYGLSIVEPAKAGPFDLEHTLVHSPACDCLIVRAKIEVDRTTAALTVTANSGAEEDAIPTVIEGVPLEIKDVNVTITRKEFIFNPTDCEPLSLSGVLTSAEGAVFAPSPVSFHVTNCAALAFTPTFAGSTQAHNTRTEGASLKTTVTYPSTPQGTEADIAKVKVSLPAKLPARLSTLQKACPEKTFAEDPANCPAPARVGEATTSTPVLPNTLSGPAYFVSHGEAKYPELVIELKGDNVTIDLHGETAISKKGVLTSTFNTVPDAPFSSFELTLPEGHYSALTANGANLCKTGSLTMPTELVAQDGTVIKQSTKVKITGCPKKTVHRHRKKGRRKGKKK